jgi:hypothetical protein
MKNKVRLTVLVLAGALAYFASARSLAAQAPSVFEPRVERHQGPPLWISAREVAHPGRVVDLDRIASPALRRSVDLQRQALGGLGPEKQETGEKPAVVLIPSTECTRRLLSTAHRGGEAPSGTLSDLATQSRSIVRGIVRSFEPGFSFGEPTTLLEVEATAVIRGESPPPTFYVDYPIAHFKIGPFQFCNGNRGFEPRPGDEILLFDYTGPVDRTGILYAPRFDQLAFQRPGGVLRILPPGLKNAPGKPAGTLEKPSPGSPIGRAARARHGIPNIQSGSVGGIPVTIQKVVGNSTSPGGGCGSTSFDVVARRRSTAIWRWPSWTPRLKGAMATAISAPPTALSWIYACGKTEIMTAFPRQESC